MPVKAEVFAAWLQIEKDIAPEQWRSTQEMLDGMFKRIDSFINTGKPISTEKTDFFDEETDGFSDTSQQKDTNDEYNAQLENFYSENWLTNNNGLMKKFEINIYNRFQNTCLNDEERFKLAFYLATSLSLSMEEKARVMKAAEELDEDGSSQLTKEKCLILMDVFVDERERFLNIEKNIYNISKIRIHEKKDELYLIFSVIQLDEVLHWDKWHLKVTEVAHTDLWEEQSEHKFNDYKCKNNSKNTTPVLRGVIPVSSQRDMVNLEAV